MVVDTFSFSGKHLPPLVPRDKTVPIRCQGARRSPCTLTDAIPPSQTVEFSIAYFALHNEFGNRGATKREIQPHTWYSLATCADTMIGTHVDGLLYHLLHDVCVGGDNAQSDEKDGERLMCRCPLPATSHSAGRCHHCGQPYKPQVASSALSAKRGALLRTDRVVDAHRRVQDMIVPLEEASEERDVARRRLRHKAHCSEQCQRPAHHPAQCPAAATNVSQTTAGPPRPSAQTFCRGERRGGASPPAATVRWTCPATTAILSRGREE